MRLLVHGSGFKSPFPDTMTEIRCSQPANIGGNPNCTWSPSNPDMETLGRTSGGSTPAANLTALADVIEQQPVGSIDELRILGHSSNEFFALGGTIVTNDPNIVVRFDETAMMGQSRTFLGLQSRFHRLRDRFAEKGKVTLAGCGSGGTNAALLDLVSRTFLVCVAGFIRPIQYALNITPNAPIRKDSSGKIIGPPIGRGWVLRDRGRVSYSSATLRFEEVLGPSSVDTLAFGTNAWNLQSDAVSCAGQLIVDAAKRSSAATVISAMGSATELGWRILQQFFPEKVQLFSGVKADETLRGLRFEAQGRGGMLVVGKPYAQHTTASTIDQRVREMGELVELAEFKRSGVVMMK